MVHQSKLEVEVKGHRWISSTHRSTSHHKCDLRWFSNLLELAQHREDLHLKYKEHQ